MRQPELNLIGQRYGQLTVIAELKRRKRNPGPRYFMCKCDCGNMTRVRLGALRSGNTIGCGCLNGKCGPKPEPKPAAKTRQRAAKTPKAKRRLFNAAEYARRRRAAAALAAGRIPGRPGWVKGRKREEAAA
jgi:hypothetical protein